jgi:hypothetical protein
LAPNKEPRSHEVVLFKLAYKNFNTTEAVTHTRFAALTLPKVALTPLTAAFSTDAALPRTIEVSGLPFGIFLDYTWSVQVLDSDGVLVYESQSFASDVKSCDIAASATDAGKAYKVRVSAGLKPRYLGYPDYVVRSADLDWTP